MRRSRRFAWEEELESLDPDSLELRLELVGRKGGDDAISCRFTTFSCTDSTIAAIAQTTFQNRPQLRTVREARTCWSFLLKGRIHR